MLEVICVGGGSKKVIKGQKYIVEALWEDSGWRNNLKPSVEHNGKLVLRRKVRLKGGNEYFVEKFKSVDNRSIYDIPVFGKENKWSSENAVKPDEKNYTGQYVLCRSDHNSKYLKTGEIYYVEDHKITDILRFGRNYKESKFKLTGLKRYINVYGFDEIPLKDQRKLKLQSISGKEITSGLNKRKFLYFSDVEKIKVVIGLYLDAFKNLEAVKNLEGITIVDVIVDLGKKYDMRIEDVTPIINKSLKNISEEFKLL